MISLSLPLCQVVLQQIKTSEQYIVVMYISPAPSAIMD